MKKIYALLKTSFLILFIVSLTPGNASANKPILRLLMNTSNFNDETVFYFEQGGTTSFQPAFDAYKLLYNTGTFPYIGSMSDSVLTSISGLPELPSNLSIFVKAITPSTKSFTFSVDKTDFHENVCVTLYDTFTGISTNILTSDYVCTLYDTTSTARFKINFFTTNLNASSLVINPECLFPAAGVLISGATDSGPWNYEWKNGDSIVKTSLNKNTADSLQNLTGGNYSVKISSVGQCSSFAKDFFMPAAAVPTASFLPDAFVTKLSNSGKINFTNTSVNAQFSSWDFGDNSGTLFVPSPSHSYLSAGVYTVTLITESIDHCKATAQQVINIVDDVTGITSLGRNSQVRLCSFSQGNYELRFLFSEPGAVEIELVNLEGKLIKADILTDVFSFNYVVNLGHTSPGIYLLNVRTEGSLKTFKLLN